MGRIHSLFFKVSRAAKIIQTDLQFYKSDLQVSLSILVEDFPSHPPPPEYGVGAYSDSWWVSLYLGGRDRVVGIATRNGFRTPIGARFSGPNQTGP
jgi:hypothetical protein